MLAAQITRNGRGEVARWPPLFSHPMVPQVKWGADFLINSHVDDYVYMGSMGNATEGACRGGGARSDAAWGRGRRPLACPPHWPLCTAHA